MDIVGLYKTIDIYTVSEDKVCSKGESLIYDPLWRVTEQDGLIKITKCKDIGSQIKLDNIIMYRCDNGHLDLYIKEPIEWE